MSSFDRYHEFSLGGKAAGGMKLATHLHAVTRIKMSGMSHIKCSRFFYGLRGNKFTFIISFLNIFPSTGAWGSVAVKALRY
jgi:hypothetical protein